MKRILQLALLFMVVGLFQVACTPEPIKGCTNKNAENYNAEAEEADGSCVFARDKFLGTFKGKLLCGAPLPPSSEFTMLITEGLSGDNAVTIEFKDTENPLPILNGTAEGNKITVPQATYKVALDKNNPNNLTDVIMESEATLSEDKKTISGTLTATISGFPVTCTYEATK